MTAKSEYARLEKEVAKGTFTSEKSNGEMEKTYLNNSYGIKNAKVLVDTIKYFHEKVHIATVQIIKDIHGGFICYDVYKKDDTELVASECDILS